jgi:hypothetical protein
MCFFKNIWFEGCLECSDDNGKVSIVMRAFFGLKNAGVSWRLSLVEVLVNIGFQSMKADLDVWICSAVFDDTFEYIVKCCLYLFMISWL